MTFLDLPGESANSPFFSPDGRWIGYTTAGAALRKVAVSGGPSLLVAETGNAAIGAWGPDSIVYTDQQGMFRVPPDGGRPVVVPLDLADHEQPTFPEVLPGGRVVLFTVIATRSNTPAVSAVDPGSRVDAVDLVTGRRTTLVRGGGHPRYLRSGHLVFGAGGSIRAVAFDPQTLEVRGTPVEVLRDTGSAYFEVAHDGTLIYMRGGAHGRRRRRWCGWIARAVKSRSARRRCRTSTRGSHPTAGGSRSTSAAPTATSTSGTSPAACSSASRPIRPRTPSCAGLPTGRSSRLPTAATACRTCSGRPPTAAALPSGCSTARSSSTPTRSHRMARWSCPKSRRAAAAG